MSDDPRMSDGPPISDDLRISDAPHVGQDCLARYQASLLQRVRSGGDIGHGALVPRGEFPCPLCRGLGTRPAPSAHRWGAAKTVRAR